MFSNSTRKKKTSKKALTWRKKPQLLVSFKAVSQLSWIMSWRCSVRGCGKRNQAKANGVVIHRFPEKDLELCSKWLAAIGRDENKTEKKYASLRVCSQHFTPDDYERDLKAELLGCPPKKILKKTAIPSIFQTKRKPGRRPSRLQNKSHPEVKLLCFFTL